MVAGIPSHSLPYSPATDALPVLPSELPGAALEPNRRVGEDLPRKAD
jgi:hypothetical protein